MMNTSFANLTKSIEERVEALKKERFVHRLWEKDPSLWTEDPTGQEEVRNRLGWLSSPEFMQGRIQELKAFAQEIKRDGFTDAVVLGMGGSVLCPEVFRIIFGGMTTGLRLQVLDSTTPGQVQDVEKALNLERTLFLVASKSGTTPEMKAFHQYFSSKAKAPEQFVAITDPSTPLSQNGVEKRFRRVFENPANIGGRFSALSYFGLVPAALMGMDLNALLTEAVGMMRACQPEAAIHENPGVCLGAFMGEAATAGRDKLTLWTSPKIESFGVWIEQLISESVGKEGKGIIPVLAERSTFSSNYGKDRVFVCVRFQDDSDGGLPDQLRKNDVPFVEIILPDASHLGAEMYRWEVATAVAGSIFHVNAFDQPNVQLAKDMTKKVLGSYQENGAFTPLGYVAEDAEFSVYADEKFSAGKTNPKDLFLQHLQRCETGGYVAWMAYLPMRPKFEKMLSDLKLKTHDDYKCATTFGWGPRYLHSTGQFHKGGPNTGVFVMITHECGNRTPIPGESYDFQIFSLAQALGDFEALCSAKRRVLRIHLKGPVEEGLKAIRSWF